MKPLFGPVALRNRAVRDGADRGVTLVETVVAMTIMTIFGGIFTGAVISLSDAAGKAEATTRSADALNQAYLALDRSVRYASAISTPGTSTEPGSTGNWYVELRETHSGDRTCTQLRIDTAGQQLQKRTWTVLPSPSAPTAWRALASSITNGAAAAGPDSQPFFLPPPGPPGNATSQQLQVKLTALSGSGRTETTSRSSFRFTALNSTSASPAGSICQQAGRP